MMYGVWANVGQEGDTGQQYSRCWGQSPQQVIMSHPDFSLRQSSLNWTAPSFSVTRYSAPRFVIVLENSAMMGSQWDLVRVMARNLILETEYLPATASLGIVMFNAAAYTEHPVVPLTPPNRQSLSLSIR